VVHVADCGKDFSSSVLILRGGPFEHIMKIKEPLVALLKIVVKGELGNVLELDFFFAIRGGIAVVPIALRRFSETRKLGLEFLLAFLKVNKTLELVDLFLNHSRLFFSKVLGLGACRPSSLTRWHRFGSDPLGFRLLDVWRRRRLAASMGSHRF
jgi:hypothetical protein